MKKIRGFTLIEMIITIVVIIILSSISVPMYKGYKKQAILAEGYILLGAVRDAQMTYYNRYRNFFYSGIWTSNEEVLGIDARGNKYFTLFYTGGVSGKRKYYFQCWETLPIGIRSSNDDRLVLQYNITLGQRIIDYPKTALDAWY